METLTIHAASPETARAMLAVLSEFRAELVESADGCQVVVSLGRAKPAQGGDNAEQAGCRSGRTGRS